MSTQTSNPLYLRVLLDELRVFGIHEKLPERITWYLEARDPGELYQKVITRWEDSYEDDTDLVGDVLSMLWASRNGLSETELLGVLGESNRPFPRAQFSPLFLAMSESLVSRSGLLSFAHRYLRDAVEESYLPTLDHKRQARVKLACYFQREEVWSERNFDELPWLLASAGKRDELHAVLTDQSYFLALSSRDENELRWYWRQLPSEYDMGTSYTAAFDKWTRDREETPQIADLANKLAVMGKLFNLLPAVHHRPVLPYCGKGERHEANVPIRKVANRDRGLRGAGPAIDRDRRRGPLAVFDTCPAGQQSP